MPVPEAAEQPVVRLALGDDLRRGGEIAADQPRIDIIGKLDEWTYSWERVAGTGGRRYIPRDGFSGSIELIGWDDLLKDANMRNKAFFERAGISGRSFFIPHEDDEAP